MGCRFFIAIKKGNHMIQRMLESMITLQTAFTYY